MQAIEHRDGQQAPAGLTQQSGHHRHAEVRDQAIAGDVLAAQAWAVTASQAITGAPGKLAFALPSEGFARYADNVAILRESGRAELAHQWINYLLRPEVAASIVVSPTAVQTSGTVTVSGDVLVNGTRGCAAGDDVTRLRANAPGAHHFGQGRGRR